MTASSYTVQVGDGLLLTEFEVLTRDGVTLVGDIYHSDDLDVARPVVLERTPYGRRKARRSDRDRHDLPIPEPHEVARKFVDAGFRLVRQDCRGRGDSSGSFVKYLNETTDGADTIEWLAAQGWCDGRVAMIGTSYSAHAQSAAAAESPHGLVAMWQDSGGFASAYHYGSRYGGAFELKQATWAFNYALTSPQAEQDPVLRSALDSESLLDWFGALPWRAGESPLRHHPTYESYLLDQWNKDTLSDYWTGPAIYGRGHYGSFPASASMHFGSWYDPYVRSTIENFRSLGDATGRPTFLIMGPWTHGRRCETHSGDVDFGAAATVSDNLASSYTDMRIAWLRSVLADEAPLGPAVRYFTMGGGSGRRDEAGRLQHGGRWSSAGTWPPEEASAVQYRLGADRGLSDVRDDQPVVGGALAFDADPANPVPTIGGQVTSMEPVLRGGAFDQTPDDRSYGCQPPFLPLAARPDVLAFRTEPLEEAVTITGPVVADIYLSSTAPDTDVTVKLVDEYPPSEDYPAGFAMNLTEGIQRARFRKGFDRPEFMTPDQTYAIRVTAPDTANVFMPGHRIRLDVSWSSFPRFDVNPHVQDSVAATRLRRIATNTVHCTEAHPSAVTLWRLGNDAVDGGDGELAPLES